MATANQERRKDQDRKVVQGTDQPLERKTLLRLTQSDLWLLPKWNETLESIHSEGLKIAWIRKEEF